MRKCSFSKVVIGLSGGIDSAVVAALATLAIGAENVTALLMPSKYTSKESMNDAKEVAARLKIKADVVPIEDIHQAYNRTLNFSATQEVGVAEENIQARIRGNILMAYSNRDGSLVLSTGNKSELSVGYCTLYGDMAGGLAVISDLPKTVVFNLAEHINKTRGDLIPRSILSKPPSAELRPDQTDQDSLPPYEVLDEILKAYIEEHETAETIIARGFDAKIVYDILKRVNLNEYKRRQAPPGFKITSKAFGIGRRFPIAWKA
jgi:NAD+ synthetase